MSAEFLDTSSQYLECADPIGAYPYTVGLWVRPTTTGSARTVFSVTDESAQYNRIVQRATNNWAITASIATENVGTAAGTVTANQWTFLVGRFISATNRRLSILQFDGSAAQATGTTSRAYPASTKMQVGASVSGAAYFTGQIAEFWVTNTDIQPDGLQLKDSTLRHLARQGPYSLPHIAKNIIEYRSFRSRLDSRADTPDEVYQRGTRQVWTNTNGVTLGPHPPAADNYVSPLTDMAPMVIV